ncbi:all-trans retinoic acid-induced differentiation factor isoform X2 [Colossoma macropomum]|uniref:all-trans retinoic acid-induced differentiation factor isoform X2 n=1 Tax=Colossoma macropomum TaxID=42526 RepID=UPI001863D8D1|nr:all-trans retinoic acid-induced differentiation factor isoform X2 [Colossoma macropomum]
MPAGISIFTLSALCLFYVLFIFSSVHVRSQHIDSHVRLQELCYMCGRAVQTGSAVWNLCLTAGRIEGRCCFRNNSSEENNIFGLDLSNCSLSHIEDLYEASAAVMIILPIKLECPGGNTSWDKVMVKRDTRTCEGQRNACNGTGQMSWDCPENSFCKPYGPGFFECSCAHTFHGYKCLREGQFPMLEVMAILGGSTVVLSALLWVTQRRKAKGI